MKNLQVLMNGFSERNIEQLENNLKSKINILIVPEPHELTIDKIEAIEENACTKVLFSNKSTVIIYYCDKKREINSKNYDLIFFAEEDLSSIEYKILYSFYRI